MAAGLLHKVVHVIGELFLNRRLFFYDAIYFYRQSVFTCMLGGILL
jgi:hypothetical protein